MSKYIMICPRCNSTNHEADLSAQSYSSGAIFNNRRCNDCGYFGMFFPEVDERELKRLQETKKSKTNQNRTSFGSNQNDVSESK